jgi:YesN/AraC family two-component response regulator
MTFIELINKNRIDYFVTLVVNGNHKTYSIEGLAEMSGFGSRHSLYRNFKKYHGGSPSDFIQMNE